MGEGQQDAIGQMHLSLTKREGMFMHHLLLVLPLVGLILFMFFPWPAALPLYIALLIGSLVIYWKIIQAQRRRPTTGKNAMIGGQAVVIRADGNAVEVDYQGVIWRAISPKPLHHGQQVIIDGVEGLILQVMPSMHGNQDTC
jgi:membrane protein implicated in regulation of membrane protease activity